MCGITGILRNDGASAGEAAIRAMTQRLAHRGPDGEGYYRSGPVALGHRRLAIVDLSSAGDEPMPNQDRSLWITFNGEIYNHREIRKELETLGHRFRSRTDTEVIVHAYQQWGRSCLERFNGMFAFAIWDGREKRLWLARDRIGIKPLFYAKLDRLFLFGSEIKAITAHPEFESDLDFESLAYYLALNYTPAPHSLFQKVRQLLPGEELVIDLEGRMETREYWDLTYREEAPRPEREYLEELDARLEESVRLRLMSDVPYGAFLSGGVDSSSVTYWMSRLMTEPVKTFSIGFGEPSYDELGYARQVAEHLGTDHHERIVTADAATILPEIVWHAEEPTADSSMVAVYYLSQMTRERVTMALSGDGADDILAGYETYQARYAHRILHGIPAGIRRRLIEPLVRALPVSDRKVSWDEKLRRFMRGADHPPEDAHAVWRIIFDADERRSLLRPALDRPGAEAEAIELYRRWFSRTNAEHPLNRMLYVDTRLYLPADMLVKIDRMSMTHGLEARVPFLDHHLVEFAARVPPALKLKWGWHKKYLLKKAMEGRIPKEVLWRKKQGFNLPKARWIKQELKPFVMDQLAPRRIREIGFLDPGAVEEVLTGHFDERADNSHQIWCLLTLAIWLDKFATSPRTDAAAREYSPA